MKIETECWIFSTFPTFIKVSPTRRNKYGDGMRIYMNGDAFKKDFGDYLECDKIIKAFEAQKTTNKQPMRKVFMKR